MAARRRGRSPHPLVIVVPHEHRSGRSSWRARWTDPLTGKGRSQSLTALGLRTARARTNWAVAKSHELQALRAALATGGVALGAHVTITEARAAWTAAEGAELRPATQAIYHSALDRFKDWAASAGLQRVAELTPHHLAGLRTWIRDAPRARGGGSRAPGSVNVDLRSLKAVLGAWRGRGWLQLTRDDIRDGLKLVREPRRRPRPLSVDDIRGLLAACVTHDRRLRRGTLRALPFVRFMLLTGCRLGEARQVRWDDVDIAAQLVRIDATSSKVAADRLVSLEECPTLAAELAARAGRASGPFVFGGLAPVSKTVTTGLARRLVRDYGAPEYTWQRLRQTCGTYLTNAPGIYGGASAFLSARRLGHSVKIAEDRYVGLVRVDPRAKTLEQAMGLEPLPGAADAPGEAHAAAP